MWRSGPLLHSRAAREANRVIGSRHNTNGEAGGRGGIFWVAVGGGGGMGGRGVGAAAVPAYRTGARGAQKRPPADSSRDVARKPAELLALGEVKPGQKVADFMMGGGYFT